MEKQTEVNLTEEQQITEEQRVSEEQPISGKRVEFDLTLGVKDMADFLIKHFYSRFAGSFGIAMSGAALILFFMRIGKWGMYESVILLLVGSMFTIIQPIQLWMKASTQIKKNPFFKEPLHFVFDERGVTASQKDQFQTLPWERVRQVKETSRSILIYLSTVNANIIPKEQVGDQLGTLKEIIRENMDKSVCRLK